MSKWKKWKVKTNPIITQKQLETGIWQFMIDHSVPYEKNVYKVNFGISTKEDLMRRIYARAGFIYQIKDDKEKQEELDNKIKFYDALVIKEQISDRRNRHFQKLMKTNKIKYYILLKVRNLNKYLTGKWC